MNRKQFQEWLDQFPEDTVIEVQVQQEPPAYQSWGECREVEFVDDSDETYTFTDFTGNQFVNPDSPYFGKRVLVLGTNR